MPLGFALLGMQGLSELIKRIAFLQGLIDDPTQEACRARRAEEELAEFLRSRKSRSAEPKPR